MTGTSVASPRLRTRPSAAFTLASGAALVAVATTAAALALHAGRSSGSSLQAADVVLAAAFPLVALVIVAHQPRNAVGWLLLGSGLMGPYLLAGQYAVATHHDPGPLTDVAAWYSVWGFAPYFMLWVLTPLHFPDGTLPSPRWRWVRNTAVGVIAVLVVARMFAPIESDVSPRVHNPLAADGASWLNVVTLLAAVTLVGAGGAVGLAAVVVRTRRARGDDRQRLLWLVLGVGWLVVTNVANLGLQTIGHGSDALFVAGMLGLVAAIGAGVVRHQLFDVGTALSRLIVNAMLVVLLVVAAAAALGAAGAGKQDQRLLLVAVAVAALLAAAARDQLQHLVDRAVFGQRQDPDAVLSNLRRRLALAANPLDALGQVAEGVCDALRVPGVRVDPDSDRLPPVTAGASTTDAVTLAVLEGGEQIGHLVVERRAPGARFTRRERRTLAAVADQVGVLLRRADLHAEISAQRDQVVAAREDERRRLRHDLHDGVGPSLAGIAMQLDRLADRLADQPEVSAQMRTARDDLRRTVTSVRRTVDGLRPSALDDLGLVEAARQLVELHEPRATLRDRGVPADLPAASEVAAYLIAAEALTNAMRHSGCRTCTIDFVPESPWLVVTVSDDGTGIPAGVSYGVGLRSMQDRATGVGGLLEVTTTATGTVVRAHLPLEAP